MSTWTGVRICGAVLALGGSLARGQQPCLRWEDLPAPTHTPGEAVRALTVYNDGWGPLLYAGGDFQSAGGVYANLVARWDGTRWYALAGGGLGLGPNDSVFALTSYYSQGHGNLLIAGGNFGFTASGGQTVYGIAQWGGGGWAELGFPWAGGVYGWVGALAVQGSTLFIGGSFSSVDVTAARDVAAWTGSAWVPLGGGVGTGTYPDEVEALEVFDDGAGPALYAGGFFTTASGAPVRNLAKWDGSSWMPVGVPPFDGANSAIFALATYDDGTGESLYVAGAFTEAGGISANCIVRWNGTTWSSLGSGLSSTVRSLTVFDDGSGPGLYAGGYFLQAGSVSTLHVAKWDGATWSALGAGVGQPGSQVLAMHSFDSSMRTRTLCVGGVFITAGDLPTRDFGCWDACTSMVNSFCFGDGTVNACPCGNLGAAGRGCENSQSTGGARLGSTGSPSPDSIILHSTGELPSSLSIFLQGDDLVSSAANFGDGLRCAGGNQKRMYVNSAVNGQVDAPTGADPSITVRSAALGDPITPGSTRYYQVYYRDPSPSFCAGPTGGTFNATNGVRIVW
jgi:hypothetical protein